MAWSIERVGLIRALRIRNLRLYVSGQAVTMAGLWVHRVAGGWLVWQLTNSATWLGVYAATEFAPRLVVWPFAGVVADRYDRRRLAYVFQVIAFLLAGALAVLVYFDWIELWSLLLFSLALGINTAFWQPARLSLVPMIVPREELTVTLAFISVIQNTTRFIGPALAGPIMLAGGPEAAFAFNAVTYLAVIVALSQITYITAPNRKRKRHQLGQEMLLGLQYIWVQKPLFALFLLISVFAIAVRPVAELYPAFADSVFGRGPEGLAALMSASGAGALFAGFILSFRTSLRGLTNFLVFASAFAASGTLAFALNSTFTLALGLAALLAFGITLAGTSAQTLVQASIDDPMRGRVLSLYGTLFRGAPAVGALIMGAVADLTGLATPVAFGAGIGLLLALWAFFRLRGFSSALEGGILPSPLSSAHDDPRPPPDEAR